MNARASRRRKGNLQHISGEHAAWLSQRIRSRDFTLRGLAAELAERGLKVDYRSVWEFVHAEKLSFKKSVVAGERDRPDVARRRAQWTKYQDRIEPERLVFIDEKTRGAALSVNSAIRRSACSSGLCAASISERSASVASAALSRLSASASASALVKTAASCSSARDSADRSVVILSATSRQRYSAPWHLRHLLKHRQQRPRLSIFASVQEHG